MLQLKAQQIGRPRYYTPRRLPSGRRGPGNTPHAPGLGALLLGSRRVGTAPFTHLDFICSRTNFLTSSVSNPELGLWAASRISLLNSSSEILNVFIKALSVSSTPQQLRRRCPFL